MKPDEVVNALRACNRTKGHRCSECPVLGRYNHRMCKSAVDKFAADHIESLQAELAEYEDTGLSPTAVERLQAENATLKAERDAAVRCISDIETYLELGTSKFAYKVIQAWRGVKAKEESKNEQVGI